MDIDMTYEKDNRLEFSLNGSSVAFANLLRRYSIGNVPVFAIDKVTFYENSSVMFDEYMAHRLGEVPLASESGNAKEEIILTMDVEGPATIYSRDLKSMDSKIKASLDNIPLFKLLEGQNVRLEAKARRGMGKEHGKFQAGIMSYELLNANDFKFKAESFTQLEPRTFVTKAADIIIEKCDEFEEKLSDIKKAKE